MLNLARNFMNRFKDKTLKGFVCRVALTTEVGNFNKQLDTMEIINLEAQ